MNLNFVTGLPGDSLNMWNPQRPADYGEACAHGRIYADEMVEYIQASQKPLVLGAVIQALAAAGEYSGVEAGFCFRLGQLLAAGEGGHEPLV